MFVTHHQRHQAIRKLLLILGGVFLLITAFYIFTYSSSSPTKTPWTPQEVVIQFYQFEQAGDYGSSWELLHPLIKERFSKDTYIQRRAQTFMEDLGVNTFNFTLGDSTTETSWKMSPQSPALTDVTKIPVTLFFYSDFGDLKIQQDVYVTKDKEQYRLLWPFSRQN